MMTNKKFIVKEGDNMLDNKALLNKKEFLKGMLALPDIVLTSEEADKFIDYVVDESFWADNVRIVKMDKNEKNIRYLGWKSGTRFLKPAATFASSDYVKEFSEGKITLASKKLRGAVVIYDDDLEDGIEGEKFADHLMKLVAKKVSNELDEIFYVGNTTAYAATDARSIFTGFRARLCDTTPYSSGSLPDAATLLDASSTSTFSYAGGIAEQSTGGNFNWEFKFSKMISSMPSKYKRGGLSNLRFFCNDIVSVDYIDALAKRSTVLGDNAILGDAPLKFGKIKIVEVPQMPTTMSSGVTGTEGSTGGTFTDVILTNKDNFIIALQRSLKLESKRAPEDEATYVFYSVRADVQVENPEAAVLLYNVTHTG